MAYLYNIPLSCLLLQRGVCSMESRLAEIINKMKINSMQKILAYTF